MRENRLIGKPARRVDALDKVMGKAFADVHASAREHKVDMRTGAYILAVDRVVKATESRGIWP